MTAQFSIEGKSVLLTGGSRGIGAALASGLKKAGANVSVLDKDLSDPKPDGITFQTVDLSDRPTVDAAFKTVVTEQNGLDVLINNAGVTIPGEGHLYDDEDWDRTLAVNLTATFRLCRAAGAMMIEQGRGGSIINVTSIGALQGFPNNPAYGATKGGVGQLTKALAAEWGPHGIRVNCLVPGYTHTPMNEKSWNDPALKAERAGHAMLGRWAEPEEMVGPVIFLASDASSYMTGSDLVIDGGWTAKGM